MPFRPILMYLSDVRARPQHQKNGPVDTRAAPKGGKPDRPLRQPSVVVPSRPVPVQDFRPDRIDTAGKQLPRVRMFRRIVTTLFNGCHQSIENLDIAVHGREGRVANGEWQMLSVSWWAASVKWQDVLGLHLMQETR